MLPSEGVTISPAFPPAATSGVLNARPSGLSAIGFEGVEIDTPVLESLAAAVPRARGISATGQGLAPVLAQGGRAPPAGLSTLQNAHGGPDRIQSLSRELAVATQENRQNFASEVDVVPLHEVTAEALRMLDAYLNRTDELHPMSRELLARGFTDYNERFPAPGEKVPLVDPPAPRSEHHEAPLALLRGAAEGSGVSQVRLSAERQLVAERMAATLGWEDVRGTLIDQRT